MIDIVTLSIIVVGILQLPLLVDFMRGFGLNIPRVTGGATFLVLTCILSTGGLAIFFAIFLPYPALSLLGMAHITVALTTWLNMASNYMYAVTVASSYPYIAANSSYATARTSRTGGTRLTAAATTTTTTKQNTKPQSPKSPPTPYPPTDAADVDEQVHCVPIRRRRGKDYKELAGNGGGGDSSRNEATSSASSDGNNNGMFSPPSAAMTVNKGLCRVCGTLRGVHTHHCRECGRCATHTDHHCPFTMNCVGPGNFTFFLAFLVWLLIGLGYAGSLTWSPFITCWLRASDSNSSGSNISHYTDNSGGDIGNSGSDNDNNVCWQLAEFSLIFVPVMLLWLAAATLTSFHVFFLLTDLTTREFLRLPSYSFRKLWARARERPVGRFGRDLLTRPIWKFVVPFSGGKTCYTTTQ